MYVAPIFDRMPPIDTGFPSDAQTRADRLDRERREFIRTLFIRRYAERARYDFLQPQSLWEECKQAWDEKPEDC